MKLLLNTGNVKGKIISGLKNVFRKNCRHFILLLAGKNDLYLAEIICIKEQKKYKVLAGIHEKKRLDDEFFYQEALYHFCRDRNLSKLPVFISLDEEMVVIKQFDFPLHTQLFDLLHLGFAHQTIEGSRRNTVGHQPLHLVQAGGHAVPEEGPPLLVNGEHRLKAQSAQNGADGIRIPGGRFVLPAGVGAGVLLGPLVG